MQKHRSILIICLHEVFGEEASLYRGWGMFKKTNRNAGSGTTAPLPSSRCSLHTAGGFCKSTNQASSGCKKVFYCRRRFVTKISIKLRTAARGVLLLYEFGEKIIDQASSCCTSCSGTLSGTNSSSAVEASNAACLAASMSSCCALTSSTLIGMT